MEVYINYQLADYEAAAKFLNQTWTEIVDVAYEQNPEMFEGLEEQMSAAETALGNIVDEESLYQADALVFDVLFPAQVNYLKLTADAQYQAIVEKNPSLVGSEYDTRYQELISQLDTAETIDELQSIGNELSKLLEEISSL